MNARAACPYCDGPDDDPECKCCHGTGYEVPREEYPRLGADRPLADQRPMECEVSTTDIRASAANLRLIASIFDGNAAAATDPRLVAAWDTAMLHVLDAADALLVKADDIDGLWTLPLELAA